MISAFDLFKIGIGPSSSHTVGPMVAARRFKKALDSRAVRVRVELLDMCAKARPIDFRSATCQRNRIATTGGCGMWARPHSRCDVRLYRSRFARAWRASRQVEGEAPRQDNS